MDYWENMIEFSEINTEREVLSSSAMVGVLRT